MIFKQEDLACKGFNNVTPTSDMSISKVKVKVKVTVVYSYWQPDLMPIFEKNVNSIVVQTLHKL